MNVSGSTTAAGGLLTGVRRSINSAFVSAAGFLDPVADALPARPTVIGRAAWGANQKVGGCRPRVHPIYGRVKAAVVHHTVTANDYSAEEAPAIVLGICRYHRNGNGWNDIGYNALVDRFGNIYAGRAGGLERRRGRRPRAGLQRADQRRRGHRHAHQGPDHPAVQGSLVDWLSWKLAVSGLNAIGKTTLVSAGGDLSRYPSGRRVRLNRIIGHGDRRPHRMPGRGAGADRPEAAAPGPGADRRRWRSGARRGHRSGADRRRRGHSEVARALDRRSVRAPGRREDQAPVAPVSRPLDDARRPRRRRPSRACGSRRLGVREAALEPLQAVARRAPRRRG